MNQNTALNDEQWNRLLDNMTRQPRPSAVHARTSDHGYGDFGTENLSHAANESLGHSVNYAEANLNTFAAPQMSEIPVIDDHSLTDLRVLSKELEIVKQR